ncbi:TetR family transcriptional regulator [Corynebacterium atypicum]|uniref:TetR family transcriptional regulator n=1 Tax=Corynebacterium atypicum TaxID=191610 RepID=A0ABM5QMW2_9CORY|nr:TetR/AcrR family transcriptional regulator [Corynebacterium atypicum]AIG64110.1 TetR family transcriptional regulator [Corynebacterium atypicum]
MPVVSEDELAKRRNEILEKARGCFARYGYEGATVRRLEEYTGKSRGAIFHHFGDKETLFLAIARLDAERQADIVAQDGLVEVMRDIIRHPERHEWLATRVEIARLLRTDEKFRQRWNTHQAVLDRAVRARLESGPGSQGMRSDVRVEVLTTYLETVMEGLISQLAAGENPRKFDKMLDLVESSVRGH